MSALSIKILENADATTRAAADFIAAEARTAVAVRGRFLAAFSGGQTPWQMLRALASESIPWETAQFVQVDERIAPLDSPDRNFAAMRDGLSVAPLRSEQLHPMPVEDADLEAAALRYSQTLQHLAGEPPVLDLGHLGLGADGHTASLLPGDAALEIQDADVALTGIYQGRRRMTLTFPILNRARRVLWLVTGASKAEMLARLIAGDPSIPAGRIQRGNAVIFADRAAAQGL